MAENLKLLPPTKLDQAGMDAFVRQLNLRLEQLARDLEKRDKSPTLKAALDANRHRLTNIGKALSVDDALPLGQLEEALDDLDAQEGEPTSEAEETAGGRRRRRTSRDRRLTEDQIAQSLLDAVALVAPPNVDHDSELGTTSDPPVFALSDHTHGLSARTAAAVAFVIVPRGQWTSRRPLRGTYGDSSNTPVVTVDAEGRVTAITTAAISSSGASSWSRHFLTMGA